MYNVLYVWTTYVSGWVAAACVTCILAHALFTLSRAPSNSCMYAIYMLCTCAIKCIAFAAHTHTHVVHARHTPHHTSQSTTYVESIPPHVHVQHWLSHHTTSTRCCTSHACIRAHTTNTWASCRFVTTVQLAQGHSSLLSPHFALVQGGFGSCVLSLIVPKMGLSLCNLHWCFPSNYSVYMLPFILMAATPAACTSVLFPMPISAFSYQ